MSTHTFAILEVSKETYEEIAKKLVKAGYEHAFHEPTAGRVIDMHGIALMQKEMESHSIEGTREWYIAENERLRKQIEGYRGAGIFDGDL